MSVCILPRASYCTPQESDEQESLTRSVASYPKTAGRKSAVVECRMQIWKGSEVNADAKRRVSISFTCTTAGAVAKHQHFPLLLRIQSTAPTTPQNEKCDLITTQSSKQSSNHHQSSHVHPLPRPPHRRPRARSLLQNQTLAPQSNPPFGLPHQPAPPAPHTPTLPLPRNQRNHPTPGPRTPRPNPRGPRTRMRHLRLGIRLFRES